MMQRRRRENDRLCGIRILFEDKAIIVIDKPAGMLTTHTKLVGRAAREAQLTAENVLTDYVRKGQWKSSKRVYLVHRLDRETSGVMMFAKEERFAGKLRENWNETTEKTYLAKVEGAMETEHGVYASWLKEDDDGYRVRSVAKGTPGAKFAKTEWRVLSTDGKTSEVEVKLHSGRKNQIRVHFSEAGHPVVGDVKYRGAKSDRMYLHALRLAFPHPVTGERMLFAADIFPLRAAGSL